MVGNRNYSFQRHFKRQRPIHGDETLKDVRMLNRIDGESRLADKWRCPTIACSGQVFGAALI